MLRWEAARRFSALPRTPCDHGQVTSCPSASVSQLGVMPVLSFSCSMGDPGAPCTEQGPVALGAVQTQTLPAPKSCLAQHCPASPGGVRRDTV